MFRQLSMMRGAASVVLVVLLGIAVGSQAKPKTPSSPPSANDVLWAKHARSLNDPNGTSKKAGAPSNIIGEPGSRKLTAIKSGKCKPIPSITWVPLTTGKQRYVEAFFNTTPSAAPANVSQIANVTLLLLNRGSPKPVIAAIDVYVLEPVAAGAALPATHLLPIYRAATLSSAPPAPACPGFSYYAMTLHGSSPSAPWWSQAGVLGVRVTVGEGGSGAAALPGIASVGLGLKAPWRVGTLG